jgi:hypothetical protein
MVSGSGVTTLTPPLAASGRRLHLAAVARYHNRLNSESPGSVATPAGWTLVDFDTSQTVGVSRRNVWELRVYARLGPTTAPTFAITPPGGTLLWDDASAFCAAWTPAIWGASYVEGRETSTTDVANLDVGTEPATLVTICARADNTTAPPINTANGSTSRATRGGAQPSFHLTDNADETGVVALPQFDAATRWNVVAVALTVASVGWVSDRRAVGDLGGGWT